MALRETIEKRAGRGRIFSKREEHIIWEWPRPQIPNLKLVSHTPTLRPQPMVWGCGFICQLALWLLPLTEVWVAALEQEQDEAWAGRFLCLSWHSSQSLPLGGRTRFGSTLPPIPSLISLAWDWKQPKSDHSGSISPFNTLVRPCQPLALSDP